MADQVIESSNCPPIGVAGTCTGGANAGVAKWEVYNDNSSGNINHAIEINYASDIGGYALDLHKASRSFSLSAFLKPAYYTEHPQYILAQPPYVYRDDGSVDWRASSYTDGIFGNHAADKYLCNMTPDQTNVNSAAAGITVAENYHVIDAYLHTVDLDSGAAIVREVEHTYSFNGSSNKVACYISYYGPHGTEIALLNARATVQVAPVHTVTTRLKVIYNGKAELLDTKTETVKAQNVMVAWPPYLLDNTLTNDSLDLDVEDQEEYWDHRKIVAAYNSSGWKPIVKLDWDWSSILVNYYWKAEPVKNPGDKESLDGSMRDHGDFFNPEWLKNGVGRTRFYSELSARRALMDYEDRDSPPSDAERSFVDRPVSVGSDWFSNDASFAQTVKSPKDNSMMYSCYDAAFGKTYSGYFDADGVHSMMDTEENLMPISCIKKTVRSA